MSIASPNIAQDEAFQGPELRFRPYVDMADAAIVDGVHLEESFGGDSGVEIADAKYQEALDDLQVALNRGYAGDNPRFLVLYSALLGSVARTGRVEQYRPEYTIDGQGHLVLSVPDRQENISKIARRLSLGAFLSMAREPKPDVETVVEAGVVTLETISSLEQLEIIEETDSSDVIIEKLEEVLEANGNPQPLCNVVNIVKNHPERQRPIARGGILALVEGSVDNLLDAAA